MVKENVTYVFIKGIIALALITQVTMKKLLLLF